MQTSFFEIAPLDCIHEILSQLSLPELLKKCFEPTNKNFRTAAVLVLLKKEKDALRFQRKFLKYCFMNPKFFACLNQHSSILEPALRRFLKRPDLDPKIHILAFALLCKFPQNRPNISPALLETLEAKLSDEDEQQSGFAFAIAALYVPYLTPEENSLAYKFVRYVLDSPEHITDLYAYFFGLTLQQIGAHDSFESMKTLLALPNHNIQRQTYFAIAAMATDFKARQARTLLRLIEKRLAGDYYPSKQANMSAFFALLSNRNLATQYVYIKRLMTHQEEKIRLQACQAVAKLSSSVTAEEISKFLQLVQERLSDINKDVEDVAKKLFARLLLKVGAGVGLSHLKTALGNEKWHIREQAYIAIVALITHFEAEQICELSTLVQKNWAEDNIRDIANQAFAKLLVRSNLTKPFSHLKTTFALQREEVRRYTFSYIPTILSECNAKQQAVLLDLVQEYLADKDPDVRVAASHAFAALLLRCGTEERSTYLEKALKHDDYRVREQTCYTIFILTPDLDPKQQARLLPLVQASLADKEFNVIHGASYALAALLKMLGTTKSFTTVKTLLAHADFRVREQICLRISDILLDAFEVKHMQELLPLVTKLLADDYEDVRDAACDAFAKSLTRLDSPTCFESFKTILSGKKWRALTRRQACMGIIRFIAELTTEQAAELLPLVKARLADKDIDARNAAAQAVAWLHLRENAATETDFTEINASLMHEDRSLRPQTFQKIVRLSGSLSTVSISALLPLVHAYCSSYDDDLRNSANKTYDTLLLKLDPTARCAHIKAALNHQDSKARKQTYITISRLAEHCDAQEMMELLFLLQSRWGKYSDEDFIRDTLLSIIKKSDQSKTEPYLGYLRDIMVDRELSTHHPLAYQIFALIIPALSPDVIKSMLPVILKGLATEDSEILSAAAIAMKYAIRICEHERQAIQLTLHSLLSHETENIRLIASLLAVFLLEFGLSCITKDTTESPEVLWLKALENLRQKETFIAPKPPEHTAVFDEETSNPLNGPRLV